jgi:hypothetical protein
MTSTHAKFRAVPFMFSRLCFPVYVFPHAKFRAVPFMFSRAVPFMFSVYVFPFMSPVPFISSQSNFFFVFARQTAFLHPCRAEWRGYWTFHRTYVCTLTPVWFDELGRIYDAAQPKMACSCYT